MLNFGSKFVGRFWFSCFPYTGNFSTMESSAYFASNGEALFGAGSKNNPIPPAMTPPNSTQVQDLIP